VVLVFDADEAGTKAAERALETFLAQQVQVRVATIPQGKDPCDFCLAEGIEAFGELIDKAPDALQYVWDRRLAAFRQAGGNLADRQRVVEDFLRLVASSEVYGAIDEVRRGQLAQHIGHILNVPAAELQQQMKRLTRRIQRRSGSGQPVEGSYRTEPVAAPERYLLEVILAEPELFDQASERVHPEDFTDPRLRWLAERIWARGEQGPLRLEELLADPQLAEVAGWIVQLSEAGERRGNNEATLRGVLDLLAHRQSDAELRRLKEQGLNDDALRRVEQSARGANPRRIPRIM
jgi:DNA primase